MISCSLHHHRWLQPMISHGPHPPHPRQGASMRQGPPVKENITRVKCPMRQHPLNSQRESGGCHRLLARTMANVTPWAPHAMPVRRESILSPNFSATLRFPTTDGLCWRQLESLLASCQIPVFIDTRPVRSRSLRLTIAGHLRLSRLSFCI